MLHFAQAHKCAQTSMLAAAVSRLARQSWLHRCVYHGIAVTSPSRALATDASAGSSAGATSSSSGSSHVDGAHHFNVRAYYLGSDVDIQAAADRKLTQRCLLVGKDFAVFSLGPDGSLTEAGHSLAVNPMQHVMQYGAMVAFRFGSVVFFQPTDFPTPHIHRHDTPTSSNNPSSEGGLRGAEATGNEGGSASGRRGAGADAPSGSGEGAGPGGVQQPLQQGSQQQQQHPQHPSQQPSNSHRRSRGLKGDPGRGEAPSPSNPSSPSRRSSFSSVARAGAAAAEAASGRGATVGSDGEVPPAASHLGGVPFGVHWQGVGGVEGVEGVEEAEGRLLAGWLRQREEEEAAAELQKEMKRVIRTVVKDPVATMPRTEGASVVLRPHMKGMFSKETDRMAIRELDLGVLEVVCRVIGQSAALEFYTSKVGESLRDFDNVLADLADNAGKPFFRRPFLFQRLRGGKLLSTIASSSLMYNKVVSKLGLLDTSRTAWESDVHDIVWKGLKKEYELEQRFENLLKKLDIYKEESRFILEVRNERGSAAAEKVIIILIALEIVVNAGFHIHALYY